MESVPCIWKLTVGARWSTFHKTHVITFFSLVEVSMLQASSTTTTTLRSDNITTTTAATTITAPPPPPIVANFYRKLAQFSPVFGLKIAILDT